MTHPLKNHGRTPVRALRAKPTCIAAACAGLLVATGSAAQQAPSATRPAATATQSVVVTGIRGSLETSLSLKRDAQGWVDGITAEDIGKFPDTNLAESLQRISGVSIDRTIGEGSRITVRGAGPDHNLVLLNGRQMPASSILETAASGSRAFDFANLASESISALEVYKTSRASTPTGGIGATVNIKTARPLDVRGTLASVGIKGVLDRSNDRLPDAIQGSGITPEISGIYSSTFADGRFGVAISGSYQERDLGYNQASVQGWRPFKGDESNWGTIPQPGSPGAADITNRPKPGDLYSVPQNINYSVNGLQRQRTNGQLTLQFTPFKGLVTTLDHTYSENKIQNKRHELSAWFNFGPSVSSWTDGPVAGPKFYAETIVPPTSDIAMAGAAFATRNENRSTGLNVAWKASDRLRLELDAHNSTATSGADSPYGSNASLGTASFNRGTTRVDFTRDFPVLSIENSALDASLMQVTGSSFRNSYMKSAVDQVQVKGKWDLDDSSGLDFGVNLTKVKNRTAFGTVNRGTWGGATNPADYPDDLWKADSIRPYFGKISGSGSPALFNQFYTFDFEKVRAIASAVGGDPALYLPPVGFTDDSRVQEKSQSAFLQYNKGWDAWGLPMQIAAGLRYEKTDVTSTAQVPIATGYVWESNNEFSVQFGPTGFTTLKGSYNHVLPSVDFDVDLRRDTKFRASYGESIGRPTWDALQGGQSLDPQGRLDGGTGKQGNPALKPLKSKNLDLALEYYYAKASYAAVGVFVKNIDNYLGVGKTRGTPFNLTTPANGALYKEAVAQGCATTDPTCIRNYIFANYDGQKGVVADKDPDTGALRTDTNGNFSGKIAGQPGDPIASFDITTQTNQKSARIDGLEFNVQHMFGKTGFGVSANYTKVNSGLKYDNASRADQFALVGLSDSANLVGFYENDKWSVRLAYNWRDKFLSGLTDGVGNNPAYTEAYGQVDVSVGYNWNDKLSFQAEVINLNDGVQRIHGRTKEQVLFVTQTGPRYMFGMRYKF